MDQCCRYDNFLRQCGNFRVGAFSIEKALRINGQFKVIKTDEKKVVVVNLS